MKKIKYLILFFALVFISENLISQTNWYLRTGVGFPTNVTSWTDAPGGVGGTSPGAGEFALANRIWHFRNRTTASIIVPWNINAASTASVDGSINVICSVTGSISGLVDITSTGTVTISNPNQLNLNFNSLDVNSTVVYNNANVKVTSANYGNLVISQSSTLNTSASINVNGILTINSGKTLKLDGNGLYLNGASGSIAGTGTLIGDNFAWITLQGGNGGDNGTLNFSPGSEVLDYLIILYSTGTDYIKLGSKLNISVGTISGLLQAFGGIDLNGNELTIENGADISFTSASGDGVFSGTGTSGLFINGTVGAYLGTDQLFMDATNNSLSVVSLSNTAALGAGNTLNITDSLSILAGATFSANNNTTLISTTSKKGRLSTMNGSVNGNLTVQTFAKGNVTDWANLGISGIQGQTFNNWYGQIPMAIEGSTTGVTSCANTYFESVQGWNEADAYGYDTTIVVTSPINPGQGYWVYLGTNLYTTTDMVWSVSGSPVTGPVNIPITVSAQSGYNLIANPFASPIRWSSLRSSNPTKVNDAYYVYDAELGNTVSYVFGTASPASYQSQADIIPMGQAFYVQAVNGGGNLTANESDKVNFNTSTFQLLRPSNETSSSSNYGDIIRLNIEGGGYHDDAAIRFHTNATPNFDQEMDAHKLYNSPGYIGYPGEWTKRTVIATQSNNEDYSINSLPYATTQDLVIPVVARVYSNGQYTISASDLQNLPPGTCVKLKDYYTSTIHDLTAGDYVCTMSDTTYLPRFELTICMNAGNVTGVKSQAAPLNNILINKDAQGIFVDFDFEKATNAKIMVTNVLGQRLMDTKKVKVTNDNIYLDINSNDQLIFVTVETENERVTKKFLNVH